MNIENIGNKDADFVSDNATASSPFTLAEQGRLELLDLINAAEGFKAAGQKEQAIALYRLWLEHSNSALAYVAFFNLGAEFAAERDYPQSEAMFRKALELNPGQIQARLNLGNTLELQKREEEALEQWRIVAESESIAQPENRQFQLQALNNLGRLLEIKKQFQDSLDMLNESFAIDPTQKDVLVHLIFLIQKVCKWPIYDPPKGVTKKEMINGTSPLAMLAASDDPVLQLSAAKQFVEAKYPDPGNKALAPKSGYGHQKIRIGYLSSDFCMHAVSLLTIEMLELHDHDRFELYGFCWSREDGSVLRNRVVKAMDQYIRIDGMSDREAADCIRSHEIDILIDLQGLTSGARPMILADRPAVVQITYLGFPGTTGLPWIDYVIADKFLIPGQLAPYHTEKPLYMPNCFQSSDSHREVGVMPKRSDNGLPENAFVFCSFNNNYKFTPELFFVWMRILKRVPGSVLWLLADNEWARQNLCREAKKHGIKKDRLIFAERVAPPDYLARYQLADLFLDTFPFNGGTTANDALFMGLPLLTLAGRTFASRMAGSLLTNLGLPELIAANLKGYEERAVRLANGRTELKRLKERLDGNRANGVVFDIKRFATDYENMLAGVVEEIESNSTTHDAETTVDTVIESCDSGKTVATNLPLSSLVGRTFESNMGGALTGKKRKYLIAAPKYSHHSAGIHALYNLCNSLNKIGREACIILYEFNDVPNSNVKVSFSFSTDPKHYPSDMQYIKMPFFATTVEKINDAISNEYVVVYPEVIQGNPLGATRVVRYVLNSEVANGYPMGHSQDDFILTYSASYIGNYHQVLYQVFYNPIFNELGTTDCSNRTLNLTYIGKGFKHGPCPIILDSVELPRKWPSEKAQLASLLRSTQYVFSWDPLSQTLVDAIHCGAVPVILRYHPHLPEKIDAMELGPFPRVDGVLDAANNVTLAKNYNYSSQRQEFIEKYFQILNSFDERVEMTASRVDLFFI